MHGQDGWLPLVEGEARERTLRQVQELARALEAHAVPGRLPASVSGGSAGLALLFTWLDRVQPSRHHSQLAGRLLDEAMDAVASQPMRAALYSGFTGVAWAVQHLQGGEVPEEDDALADVDAALAGSLAVSPWTGEYDLIGGLVGLGVYALERLPRADATRCLEHIVSRLGELAEEHPEGLTWKTHPEWVPEQRRKEQPQGRYDLGVAHGMPGVLALLAAAVRAGVAAEPARRLLRGGWRWLMAQRLPQPGRRMPPSVVPGLAPVPARAAWCYGDPGVSLALYQAARAVEDAAWEAQALALAREAAERPVEGSGVRDAPLCHGAAGLLHLYNRLYQATGEEGFATAARRWLEHTLKLHQPGQGIGGYAFLSQDAHGAPAWEASAGLLEGTAGIALALLAAASPVEPTWDRVLLMSLRTPGAHKP